MKIREITIPVGALEPFSVLHTSDNHICLADERDNERKRKLAEERGMAISKGHPEQLTKKAEEIFAYAKEHQLPVFHTGDLIDFVSEANLDYARNLLKDADVFVAAGNHEFSQYVGEAWEDEAYKAQSFEHENSFSRQFLVSDPYDKRCEIYCPGKWLLLCDRGAAASVQGSDCRGCAYSPVGT